MQYELVSRALAYVSCLSTTSLFLTAMALIAVNVGQPPGSTCPTVSCLPSQAIAGTQHQARPVEVADAILLKKS